MQVTYVSHMGDDLMVVNAARVSFAKLSEWECEVSGPHEYYWRLTDRDVKLINYLAEHNHWTPFAHPQITLHIKAPIFVARQLFKHKVGFVENEVSRRYVDSDPELFTPIVWRGRPTDSAKQGSSGRIILNSKGGEVLDNAYAAALEAYKTLLSIGVAPEQARMVLPQSMMTEWYWTGSLAAFARFCIQRSHSNAQAETACIAAQCAVVIAPLFPISWKALLK